MKHEASPRYNPWDKMEPGDYFDRPIRSLRSLKNSASRQNSMSVGWFFIVRALPCGTSARCVRIW